jgi:hypothetical protein
MDLWLSGSLFKTFDANLVSYKRMQNKSMSWAAKLVIENEFGS